MDPDAEQRRRDRARLLYDTLVSIADPVQQLLDVAHAPVREADCRWIVYSQQQCLLLLYVPTDKPLFLMTRDLGYPTLVSADGSRSDPYPLDDDEAWPWGRQIYQDARALQAWRCVFAWLSTPQDLYAARSVCKQWQRAHDTGNLAVAQQWNRFLADVHAKYEAKGIPMYRNLYPSDTPVWAQFAQLTMRGAEGDRKYFARYWYRKQRTHDDRTVTVHTVLFQAMAEARLRAISTSDQLTILGKLMHPSPRSVQCCILHGMGWQFLLQCSDRNVFMTSSPAWTSDSCLRPIEPKPVIDDYLSFMGMRHADFPWNRPPIAAEEKELAERAKRFKRYFV